MNYRGAVSTSRHGQPPAHQMRHQQAPQQPPHAQQQRARYMQQQPPQQQHHQQQQQHNTQYTSQAPPRYAHYQQSRAPQQTQASQMQQAPVSSKPASQSQPKSSAVSTQTQTSLSQSQQASNVANTASNLAPQQTQNNQQQQQQAVSASQQASSVQTGSMSVNRTSSSSQTQSSAVHQQVQQHSHAQQVSASQQGGPMQGGGASATPSADMQSAGALDVDKGGHGQDGVMQNDVDQQSQQSLASGTTPKKKPFSSSTAVNSKVIFGTKYEVKCDETFAFYEGYVYDYDEKEQKLKVAYSWKDDQSVPVNYVRPVAPLVDANWKPKQGDHVECQAKAEESEPYGWWDCVIKTVRDSLYLITYEGWENHHEVLQHNMLRPYNDQEPFEDIGIVRATYPLKEDQIEEFKKAADLSNQSSLTYPNIFDDEDEDKSETRMDELRRIAKQTGLIHLNFSPTEQKLVLIGTRWAVSDAKMLINFAWRLRDTYKKKEDNAKQQERARQKEYDELCKCEKIKFNFHPNLTGYVIGKEGKNIEAAKNIPGVKHINVNIEAAEVLIIATDRNAAEEARHVLEMSQDYELIPNDQSLIRELIGGGKNIKDLEVKSKVIKISTLQHLRSRPPREREYRGDRDRDRELDQDGNVLPSPRGRFNQSFIDEPECEDENYQKLIIIGPKEKVDYAKLVIRQSLDAVQQKLNLLQRSKRAVEESRQNQYPPQYYDQMMEEDVNAPMNGQQPSARRQRRRERQQMTQMSSNDTSQYNYTNMHRSNNNYAQHDDQEDAEFPSLRGGIGGGGRKSRGGASGRRGQHDQAEHKETSNEDEEHGHTPWHEIDEMHEHEADEEFGDDMQPHGAAPDEAREDGDEYAAGSQRRGRRGARRGGASGRGGRNYGGGYDNFGYTIDEEQEVAAQKPKPVPPAPTKYVQKWQVKQKPNAEAGASSEQ